jgi:hypothetical protein
MFFNDFLHYMLNARNTRIRGNLKSYKGYNDTRASYARDYPPIGRIPPPLPAHKLPLYMQIHEICTPRITFCWIVYLTYCEETGIYYKIVHS